MKWLEQLGATFQPDKGSPLKVFLKSKLSSLPMHGTRELGKGLEAAIKSTVSTARKAITLSYDRPSPWTAAEHASKNVENAWLASPYNPRACNSVIKL